MPDLGEIQEDLRRARDERDAARAAVQRGVLALRELDAAIAAARREGDRRQAAALLSRRRVEAARQLDADRRRLEQARARERQVAAGLYAQEPQRLIEQLDDRLPFLLLPLRIETKFARVGDAPELRVRVFPDDVAVASHESTLSVLEAEAGRTYWAARCRANAGVTAQARTNAHRGAWNILAGRHGAYRSSWIARATTPSNWSDAIVDPALLDFPAIETRPLAWTEAPRCFVLPDRFVVVLVSGGQRQTFVGGPVPDDLVVGPDPLQSEGLITRDPATGRVSVGDDLRWVVDFDRAVEVGMALRIPLAPPWDDAPIETLLVLGIRASARPHEGAEILERLVRSHRYSDGVAILPQGAPTNNTDDAPSGFTTSGATIDETFALETDPAALVASDDPFVRPDGQRLAVALGLPLDAVRALPDAARTDVAEAIAMNRALWSATLGGFLHDMLAPLATDATIERLKAFFVSFVVGRGLLPALRVGRQPYGVLTTSALARWQWAESELGDERGFWDGLLARVTTLAGVWRDDLLPRVSYVGKPPAAGEPASPFATLLAVLGLQASSVEFYARKAVSDDYLANYIRLKGAPAEAWGDLKYRKRIDLGLLGLASATPVPLASLTFWREHDHLAGPVVDGDPGIPLSETAGIRPYDGVHNYIEWLTRATRDQLQSETFPGAGGRTVAPPAALLYQLLRHAYLAELGRGGTRFAKLRTAAFAELPIEPLIANVGPQKSLLLNDVMNLDTAKVGVTAQGGTVADYLLKAARAPLAPVERPPEAAPLADMTAALLRLAPLPTARLERLLAEHLDVCSHRLDAWIQALFARRLQGLRGAGQPGGGIYLGAFGWVEDVRPGAADPLPVAPEDIPPALGAGITGPVVEYRNAGGYVHAPSLTHAVTAAVLRNAYLSHAEPASARTMTVNLSSSRVRTALGYLEGLRNGQDLAALLGYQLERGLHEGHPGVELDEFIDVLRARFPFTSKKLTPVPDGTSAEVVEARNVVNGYDLLQFVRDKTYPYGLAGLPADPGLATSRAIAAEIDRLADAMDAIGDLLLAESVHQVVQGNYDRARGVLQSVTEGEAPPDVEVVSTPRSGRALTHRVALSLDPTQTAGWHPAPGVRAAANPALNHWLATVLPPPARVQWRVTRGVQAPEFVSLDSLALEPLDVVLMAPDAFGTLGSELERLLVHEYRRTRAVPDEWRAFSGQKTDASVPDAQALVFDLTLAAPNHVPLGGLGPLLRPLRRLVGGRPLHANDFVLPAEAQSVELADPKGHDLAELKARLETAYATIDAARAGLAAFTTATVEPLYTALAADHVVVPAWTAAATTLRNHLLALFRAGVAEALPAGGVGVTEPAIDALVAQVRTLIALLGRRLADARAALDVAFADPLPADAAEAARETARRSDARLDRYTEAGRLLMGRGFVVLPHFTLHAANQAELAAALGDPIAPDPLVVEEWLQSLTRVRPAMDALGWVIAYHDWLGTSPPALVPVQLPVHAGNAWIGTAYGTQLVGGNVMSVAIVNPPAGLAAPQTGLLVDEWTEVVPTASETTGLAFHTNRPSAQPPQTLLLALAPRLRGAWSWDDLVAVVLETLERAKLRAVEPDMVMSTAYFQALPATLTEFNNSFVATHFAQAVVRDLGVGPGG